MTDMAQDLGPDIGPDVEGANPSSIPTITTYATFTASPAVPEGGYNPDGNAPGFYCTLQDVFAEGMGVRWEELQREMDGYRVMVHPDSATVPDMITNHFIPDAEAEVDELCHQTYKPTQQTRFFDGDGADHLYLPFYPILSIDKATIYVIPSVPFITFAHPRFTDSLGVVDGNAAYADADLLVNSELGRITIPSRVLMGADVSLPGWTYNFIRGRDNIEIAWTSGYADPSLVPRSLRRATAIKVVLRCLRATGMIEHRGLAATKTGDSNQQVGREKNLPYSDLMAVMEKQANRLLVAFKRVF